MEKKTIGGFIAALRKAHGLTQKQLAEKLNVSDKAVSRWERDEAMPDLSLIPVLAEIFGVTSDEILRGERRNPDTPSPKSEEKTEKQRKRILSEKKTKYTIRSTISIGVAVLGVIAAMICNFGFLRAYIGFWVGMVFFAAAAVCQAIFAILDLSGLDEELMSPEEIDAHRLHTFKLASIAYTIILTLTAVCLPLVTVVWDTYLGLDSGSWLAYGALYGAIGLVVCFVACGILKLILAKKGLLQPPPQQLALQKLRLRFTGIGILVLVGLLLIQSILNGVLPTALRQGTEFTDWDSFKEFMETPVEDEDGYIAQDTAIGEIGSFAVEEIPIESIPSDTENIIYHDDGSVSYFEDYATEEITGKDGTVVCKFIHRNQSVWSWEVDYNGDQPIITVYTHEDYSRANIIMDMINPIYVLLYPLAAVVVLLLYRRKAKQIS